MDVRSLSRRAVGLAGALLLLGASAAHAQGEPVEARWVQDGGSAIVAVRALPFGQFSGTIVALPRGARCGREFVSRPWIMAGSGQSYTGLVPWINLRTCKFVGYGEGRWTVTADAQRMRVCGARPFTGPPGLSTDDRTRCLTFGRTGLGGSLGGRRVCWRYDIIGVRGSGEPLAGPFDMGGTVGRTAGAVKNALPGGRIGTYSVPYPAAPVSDLLRDLGRPFLDSIDRGVALLKRYVQDLARRCRSTKVALIGYSQGAAVVSQAMRELPAAARSRVRTVLLIADPYSAGASGYAVTPSQFPNATPRRIGAGSLGGRPAAAPAKTTDVCFSNDIVCDAPRGVSLAILYQGLSAGVHTTYKSCCSWYRGRGRLPDTLGFDTALQLRGDR